MIKSRSRMCKELLCNAMLPSIKASELGYYVKWSER
jgi:hypothetical protein